MYALDATTDLLETLLKDSYPLWAINAIHEHLEDKHRLGSSATYSKYDIETEFSLCDDLDALIYDFSLDINELSEDIDECYHEVKSHIEERGQLVAEHEGVLLIHNGEQY